MAITNTMREVEMGRWMVARAARVERLEALAKQMQPGSNLIKWETTTGCAAYAVCIRRQGQDDVVIHDVDPEEFPSDVLLTQLILLLG